MPENNGNNYNGSGNNDPNRNYRQQWELDRVKEQIGEIKEKQNKYGETLNELALFKATTVDKLLVITAKLEEIQEGDRVIKRIFITALVGAVLSALASLIFWAFTT